MDKKCKSEIKKRERKGPVYVNLYLDGSQRQERLDKMKQEKDEEFEKKFSFTPNLFSGNRSNKSHLDVPRSQSPIEFKNSMQRSNSNRLNSAQIQEEKEFK
jgi:hypothetical protein